MILWLLFYWFLCMAASLYWFYCLDGSLFDWLMMMVFAALSTKITKFGWLLLSIGFGDN
ncbi:hypothetical protein MtrunA17_Chr3g0138961 [Medicago truncatula]|uniref:Transmembrane protein n=1 Tax=Medicago truncatula TaxID=3880 RepID=A0A396IYE3_MEDTR|nr:hypothetical protein MtrunA17_Chr3g0138961 [Medicago truncatula]